MYFSSEGSLTQHIKLKHPDYFSKMGLTQINLKSLDDSKPLNESDLNLASSGNNNDENKSISSKEKENNKTEEKNNEDLKKTEKDSNINNNSSVSNDV